MLRFLESIYLKIHNGVYRRRLRTQKRYPDKYVISIGNLSAGGTGKTPASILLASRAASPPLVVLRGYGGSLSKTGALVSDGQTIFHGPREAGDEAVLIARSCSVPVAVDQNRQRAVEQWGKDRSIVILDDAFQNPAVYRDCDIVLVDATIPPEGVRLFPAGKFRDPVEALSRADVLVLTRTDQSPHTAKWRETARRFLPEERVFESVHAPRGVIPAIAEKRVGAFCGIGNPAAFFDTLAKMGFDIVHRRAFSDHTFFSAQDLETLLRIGRDENLPWITTEKDAVRIVTDPRLQAMMEKHLHVLDIRLEIRDGREGEFLRAVFHNEKRR